MLRFFKRRKLSSDESGVTAVEFAIISPLLFAFILGIIDISIYFFTNAQLQDALLEGSRQLRIGNAAINGTSPASRNAFRQLVCNEIKTGVISSCTTNLRVDVRSAAAGTSYTALVIPSVATLAGPDGIITDSETSYTSGGASCAVVARVFYSYTSIVPGLHHLFAAVVPGTMILSNAIAFRNEPFTSGSVAACDTSGDLN